MLQLAISPCPNDIFIFYGLLTQKVDFSRQVTTFFLDISELNALSQEGKCHFLKLSFANYFFCKDRYQVLDSGAAMGNGCGPLLVGRERMNSDELKNARIGIPGRRTTANALFSTFFPDCHNKKEVLFSDIVRQIQTKEIDCGVIIHESRFTYQDHDLIRLADLGELWEWETSLPIPLGGIFALKTLDDNLVQEMQEAIVKSIDFALEHEDDAIDFAKEFAQEMDYEVLKSHIKLYVNSFSRSLGIQGKKAIEVFEETVARAKSL